MFYSKINNLVGWLIFIVSSAVYLSTMEPTVSLWDCGEFIASASKLEVGHPPGAPFFIILARFFAIFATDASQIALMVNTLSALSSALTILFLFWTITRLAKKFYTSDNLDVWQIATIIGSGAVGALAYTFSDTFWFSAVEGEVYALSSFFTAIGFWAILKWEDYADSPSSMKWIILIAYLMGLSIGVHLLNLLTIPAIVFVYYFKKFKPTTKGVLYSIIISLVAIAFILWGIIQGSIKVGSKIELLFVNDLGMAMNSGLLTYVGLVIAILAAGIYFSTKQSGPIVSAALVLVASVLLGMPFIGGAGLAFLLIVGIFVASYLIAKKYPAVINTIMIIYAVLFIGYSSYTMIIVRSLANPPMDENNPENAFTLLSYLNREQYGENPLFKGPTFNAPVKNYGEWKYTYVLKNDKYEKIKQSREPIYDEKYVTIFPRMYSQTPRHIKQYISWIGKEEKDFFYPKRYGEGHPREGELVRDRAGSVAYDYNRPKKAPSFGDNIKFFISYQLNWMYWRYFHWNFSGRQNDEQGDGNILDGNWISGIKAIDEARLGNQDLISDYQMNHPSRNTYYMIPFFLGLLGLVFSLVYMKKEFVITIMLFFLTGIAIILYLNQTPLQPRERDYGYPGSFYAYSIWIGFSVLAIANLIKKIGENVPASAGAVAGIAIGATAPLLMGTQNWDDHDRSGRYTARDYAYNYLMTCAPNAMIFTNGDNDTFPLWYAQEVEGVRTDVRVVCLPLLSTDWYIDQMKRKAYESDALPIDMTHAEYVQGTRDYMIIHEQEKFKGQSIPLKEITKWIMSDNQQTKLPMSSNEMRDYVPVRSGYVPIKKEDVVRNNAIDLKDTALIEDNLVVTMKGSYLMKNGLAIVDILDDYNWERPIYFTSLGVDEMMSLDPYFKNEGFAYRLSPTKKGAKLDSDKMYDNLMNKYRYGGMNEEGVHMCHFNLRTLKVIGLRKMFNELAQQLMQEHKADSALAVVNRCVELMPHPKIPHDYYSLQTARIYYMLNEIEKSNKILQEFAEASLQELEFFDSLDEDDKQRTEKRADEHMYYVYEIINILESKDQTELIESIQTRLKAVSGIQQGQEIIE